MLFSGARFHSLLAHYWKDWDARCCLYKCDGLNSCCDYIVLHLCPLIILKASLILSQERKHCLIYIYISTVRILHWCPHEACGDADLVRSHYKSAVFVAWFGMWCQKLFSPSVGHTVRSQDSREKDWSLILLPSAPFHQLSFWWPPLYSLHLHLQGFSFSRCIN